MKFNKYIEIFGHEFDAEIEYSYYKACKGARNEYDVPMEPDEPCSVDIASVKIDGYFINLPQIVVTELEEDILLENHSEP